ncbi:hypothetical protein H0H81_000252 [Sphagnurus paluster]|uniref:Potassium transporter n=1 Tax=Sphagnurus paluster TaxID=117069 RepID=A0A9P7GGM6_9AGAR|nr:hypothetical protein H0H81_000252 [Sphagnurus paluster]
MRPFPESLEFEEKGIDLNVKRQAVVLRGLPLFLLSFQTLGVIYSDIGTSPLYVLNGIWPQSGPPPSKEDVIGGVSAILWALTLLPLIKYVFISLEFGTGEGEGGPFALFQGLYPSAEHDHDTDRTLTGDSFNTEPQQQSGPRRISEKVRWPLLTVADGVFTPAVSVTSAVGGIAVAKPSVNKDIVPISIALLLCLFFIQRFGTSRIAFTYAPVFLRTKDYNILAGVLLAVTGCEAVFANLGQFNALSIRISFTSFVYPALVLAYLGQGARLIHDGPAVIPNVFYNTIPGPHNGPLFWVVFIFAILATIIASQALISATFSLVQQLIHSKAFPPIRMVHTSEFIQGQIYIPAVNWLLMFAVIIVVAAFSDLQNLTNAYGFSVATVMLTTSMLIAVHIYYVKNLSVILAIGYTLIFGFFDGESLEDVFDDGNRKNLRYFIQQESGSPEILQIPARRDSRATVSTEDIEEQTIEDTNSMAESPLDPIFYYMPGLREKSASGEFLELERRELARIPTFAVFHKVSKGKGVPHSFIGFIRQWPGLPRVVIFLSICIISMPRVPRGDRYAVTKVRTIEGFYGVTYYVGFRDIFDVQVNDLIDKICEVEQQVNPGSSEATIQEIRAVSGNLTHMWVLADFLH